MSSQSVVIRKTSKDSTSVCRKPTVQMSREELDALLGVDAALGTRDDIHTRPTVRVPAAVAA